MIVRKLEDYFIYQAELQIISFSVLGKFLFY